MWNPGLDAGPEKRQQWKSNILIRPVVLLIVFYQCWFPGFDNCTMVM